jgi:pyruvate dehydrogenase E2 component (dihydrolipoamide acetyltransferase)
MAIEVRLVKAGMTMTEGAVAEWYVPDGGAAEKGKPLYRMETEKIELEVEADASGVVRHVVPAGATLEPGGLIAYILTPGEAPPAGLAPGSAPPAAGERVLASPIARRLARESGIPLGAVAGSGPSGRITEADVRAHRASSPSEEASTPVRAEQAVRPAGEVLASPLARRLAEQQGIELAKVQGTGPNGRITREDVEAFAAAHGNERPLSTPAGPTRPERRAGQTVPMRGMRKVIAERMHASLRDMAQLTMAMEVTMDEAVKLRAALVAEWAPLGIKPSYTDLVIKAVAKALVLHPLLNAIVRPGEIELLPQVHVGMAVALDEGLVVPVIRDADALPLKDLAATSTRLADAARSGTLGLDDMAGATFSVTALGMAGVDLFTPIINPPNVAILGVGRIREGLAWDGDRPVKQHQMTLSLTIDHRAVDGAPGAAFLNTVRELLEAPYRLLV